MIVLSATADVIRVLTSTANAVAVHASFVDNTTTAYTPSRQNTAIASIATTTVVSSPAASTQRHVKHISFRATGGANVLTVQFFDGTTAFQIFSASLASGEHLEFNDLAGWRVLDAAGQVKYVVASGGIAGHVIESNGTPITQRPNLNFNAAASFPNVTLVAADDAVNTESDITAQIAAMAANTFAVNNTASPAAPVGLSPGAQGILLQAAANIIAATCGTDQALQRVGSADLGFSTTRRLLRAPQVVLATNATFAHPTGTAFIIAIVVAGGGGGGGAVNSAASQITLGGGGASGGHLFHTFTSISGTSNVTIGAAGAAGANTGAAAGAGGNSSVVHNGVTVTAIGGPGAPANTTVGMAGVSGTGITSSPGALPPAVSTSANLNGGGNPGAEGLRYSGTAGQSGSGAGCIFGGGGIGRTTQGAGNAAIGPGGGGAGGLSISAGGAVTGGAGGAGFVIFLEFS